MDHKDLQKLYHQLNRPSDFLHELEDEIRVYSLTDKRLISRVIDYFTCEQPYMEFPIKSYVVAIVYASMIERYFNVPFYHSLNDPALLYYNDKYFVKYRKHHEVYDEILSHPTVNNQINGEFADISHLNATVKYFKQEFLIDTPYYTACLNQ